MKYIIALIMVLSIVFCSSKRKDKNHKTEISVNKLPWGSSTLDSLQGTWVRDDNPNSLLTVFGRNFIESYKDSFSNITITNQALVYFSNTLLDLDNSTSYDRDTSFHPIIDTISTTGNYLIFKYGINNYDCFEFNGFNIDNSDTTFSFQPLKYWKASSIIVYKKI